MAGIKNINPDRRVGDAGLIFGVDPLDTNVVNPMKVSSTGYQQVELPYNQSQFGEIIVANRTPIIELNSAYGLSELRNLITETDGGTLTTTDGEIVLSTGTTGTAVAAVDTSKTGRYLPGMGAQAGIGIRLDTLPTGNQKLEWGLSNATGTEGLYFGIDAAGRYVSRVRDNVEQRFNKADWNIDKLDGTGPSGITLDDAVGLIHQIEYTWYGYGQIKYCILLTNSDNVQRAFPVHSITVFDTNSLRDPNLRISVKATNNGTASDFTAYLGGRQYSVIGKYAPKFRSTSAFGADKATTTTAVPIVSLRRKAGFVDRNIEFEALEAIANTEPHLIQVIINGTLTGTPVWETPTGATATETALESDTSATGITGGILVYQQLVAKGAGNRSGEIAVSDLSFNLPDIQNITLAARTISGAGTLNAGLLRMKEEW